MKCLAAILLLVLTFGCTHTRVLREPQYVRYATRPLDIQAHRGDRWTRPENTLSSFRSALDMGVTTLEIDAVLTKDGVVMVTHDHQINPVHCVDGRGRRFDRGPVVLTLTRAQVQSYDCGGVDPAFPAQVAQVRERIPTLDELYAMALAHPHGKNVVFSVETKIGPADQMPPLEKLVDAILKVMRKHNAVDRSLLSSFDIRSLQLAHAREPRLTLSWLLGDRPSEDPIPVAVKNGIQIISPSAHWIGEEDVNAVQSAGLRIIPWTVNDPSAWTRLLGYGVDGIITDNPRSLIEYYKSVRPVETSSANP